MSERILPPHGQPPASDGLACRYCGRSTPWEVLSKCGARCEACLAEFEQQKTEALPSSYARAVQAFNAKYRARKEGGE